MKRFLFTIVIAGVTLAGCCTKSTYKINGIVEEGEGGEVFIVTIKSGEQDTLGKSNITDGRFSFIGEINEPTQAYFVVKDMRTRVPFFLECGTYTVKLGKESRIEGGRENQSVLNQYTALKQSLSENQNKLRQKIREARQAEDYEKVGIIQEELKEIEIEADKEENAILESNSNLFASAYNIASSMGRMDVDKLKEKYNILRETAKSSSFGKTIAERIKNLEAVAIGEVAPNFTLETSEGETISLHEIKAKLKIVDFWASWCKPCRIENPSLVAIYEEYHSKGLEIIGVSLDSSKEAWIKAINDDNLIWIHVSDLKGWQAAPAKLYAVSSVPFTFILDEDNVIIAKKLKGSELKAKISELLD